MSYKTITKASYQATADAFASKVADLAPLKSIEKFMALLPPKSKIIDVGCGSGRDAKVFTDKGVDVLGIDFCPNLIEIAKETAPSAHFQIMDMEEMSFPAQFFDGAWVAASLFHLPKKAIPSVLKNIHTFLKNKGAFYLSVMEGSGEHLLKDHRYEGHVEKFWSYFEENELQKLLEEIDFEILELERVDNTKAYQLRPYFRAICQKKEMS